MLDFTDRVAMVTGAARGIGKATALRLADRGADVVVTDVVEEREAVAAAVEERGQSALALDVDVSDEAAVEAAAEETIEEFGRIDALVNNAGIFPAIDLAEMTAEDWQHVIDVNLTGAFYCTQAVLPAMREQGYGRIVNVSSVSGGRVGWAGNLAHYAASKAGMVGFTRSAALDIAPDGVTINAVVPGMIDTGAAQRVSSDEEIEAAVASIPLGRQGDPEELANVIAFLASEESSYVTGASVVVDGGITKV
ncbi:3-oxoacyl-[acyl-carrier protein] reductase [Natronoarchaeum philippinense]|uniref:3-oxoacyl-[acyl-carrier protein] reductase n=1 Tax=Natronoarchaeum philippinense TaxID=558529 RepID=A0A285N1D7_NATPI|nr:SDR family NAD(P)-dependent oxidoreductase [Natronoarchaeum philippinense]SNZ03259.1 3-oxoacyl-[acyl-carrier protein] reductase [Natronoarchaeum philippinense]